MSTNVYNRGASFCTGVAVPDAGCDAVAVPGEGISPKGSFKYALKKLRQLALDGMKCPVASFSVPYIVERT